MAVGGLAVALPPAPAHAAAGPVVNSPAVPLNVRSGPAVRHPRTATLAHQTPIRPLCQVPGQAIQGTERRTAMWDLLSTGGFVSDAYVRRSTALPACGAPGAPGSFPGAAAAPWTHPLPGFPVQGGFRTPQRPEHIGVDMMSFPGTPVRAAAGGKVLEVVCNIQPGGSCDVPGSPMSRGCGWYVKIEHPGRIATLYCHLLRLPAVRVGQRISAGQVIGLVGSSGRSSYPHLHFEVHVGAPPTGPQTAVDPRPFMQRVGAPLP